MLSRNALIVVLVLGLVGGVAAWSKLRYLDRDGYDNPLRWKTEEIFPASPASAVR
jgi:uncharacterized membrane-anchored protein